MAIQIFDEFLKQFEQPITAFVSNSVQNLAAAIDTPLRTAVTLWVVLYGIAILRGTIREPIMSFAWSAARVVVIVALGTGRRLISVAGHLLHRWMGAPRSRLSLA